MYVLKIITNTTQQNTAYKIKGFMPTMNSSMDSSILN